MSRRVWSKREDEKLTALVAQFGDRRGKDGKWAEISKQLSGRTNKDCRKRWFHSLDPALRRGRWTKEEDEILLEAHQRLGPAWKEIALLIKGRKDDQCAKRYNDILNPLAKDRLKDWSPEEDRYLTAKVNELGHRWSIIAAGLPDRPPLTCRNRWRRLSKDLSAMSSVSSSDLASSSDALPPSTCVSTSTPQEFSHTPAQTTDIQTPNDSQRLENEFSHLSPSVSGNPVLSPLFPMGDIDLSALENPTTHQQPLINNVFSYNYDHHNVHENDTQRSNTIHLEGGTGHDIPISGQHHGQNYDYDSFLGLLNPINANQDDLSTIFSKQNAQSEPTSSMPGTQDNQHTSIEEAAMLQVLSSTRDSPSMPNNALSTIKSPVLVQQVQHHHHFHHHHYHHHYHHYER